MDIKENMNMQMLIVNAWFEFNEFIKALESKDNEKIESTTVYKLMNLILKSNENPFSEMINQGSILYRARIIDLFDGNVLKQIELKDTDFLSGLNRFASKEPPIGIQISGRNNFEGSSYLYLAEDEYTAVSEVKPMKDDCVSVARFQVNNTLRVLNFADDKNISCYRDFENNYNCSVGRIMTMVMRSFCTNSKNDYYISQYISDLIRKYGFDGIAYRSYMSGGKNFTIFNCCEKNIEFLSSELYAVPKIEHSIVRINTDDKLLNKHSENIDDNYGENIRELIIDIKKKGEKYV